MYQTERFLGIHVLIFVLRFILYVKEKWCVAFFLSRSAILSNALNNLSKVNAVFQQTSVLIIKHLQTKKSCTTDKGIIPGILNQRMERIRLV